MKTLSIYVGAAAALATVGCGLDAKAPAPEWHVSKVYTASNRLIPGTMTATVESGDEPNAELQVACDPKSAGVFFRAGFRSMPEPSAGDDITFSYGLDGAPRHSEAVKPIGRDLLYVGSADVISEMAKSKTVEFRIAPIGEGPRSIRFDLARFPATLKTLRDACKTEPK